MQLHRENGRIQAARAELVLIGNGAPSFIKGFREETGYQGKLYTDPSLESYRVVGLKRGFWRVMNPLVLAYGVRGMLRGSRQTKIKGDAHQLGGLLVVDPDGKILFQHTESVAGDLVDKDKLLSVLEKRERQAA